MTIRDSFRHLSRALETQGIETPALEASWILEKCAGISELERIRVPETKITKSAEEMIEKALFRRQQGEPLAYILEEKHFLGHRFYVNKSVLIPRPETELLAQWGVQQLRRKTRAEPAQILDLGAGSGCLGLSILMEHPNAQLTAVEISPQALEVAKTNTEKLGLKHRVKFLLGDAADSSLFKEHYDLVVANPPYISAEDQTVEENVKKYEPHLALFAGNDGLLYARSWFQCARSVLVSGGAMGFEIGSTQGPAVLKQFRDAQMFSRQYILKDLAGHDRVVCGEM